MQQELERIIRDGVLAPSGENCQPWKFEIRGSLVYVYNVPELDQSIYNFEQKGSYVAHGALIENMQISASHYGYAVSVDLFPQKEFPNFVAMLSFEKKVEVKEDPLYPFLSVRHTNRKDHRDQKLSVDQKNTLTHAAQETGLASLAIRDDQDSMASLGEALAVNERIIFENKSLHDFFYEHILWDEKDQDKAGGFYVKTLEFLPHQLKGVKLFKAWPILKILNKIGKVSRVIAKENAEKYAKSGALAAVCVQGKNKEAYVHAGRVAERVWLTAASMGLSVQPCTGILYFMENIQGGNGEIFSKEHRAAIESGYSKIMSVFESEGSTVPMLFRIGFGEPASARAMRMEPNISITQ